FARPLERLLPKLKMDWTNLRSLTLTCVPLGILGIAAYYARVVATIPLQVTQFVVFLSDLCLLVITVLFMLQLKHRLPAWGVLFLWAGLIIPRLLMGFSTGAAAQGIEIVLLLLVTLTTIRQKVPVVPLVFGVALLFITSGIKQEFRNLTWIGSDSNKTPMEKA